ncbi:MAG TPA: single-stranded-DNA-specific exonuclease RecJ, partial [Myxococcota bacterium]|nr:single-stranded-DNA-specific exonuclease RecJ [Myxococcota bacterium]
PNLEDLHPPQLLQDMDLAVERVLRALGARERVCVWGDYDVDGVTATALLVGFLRELGHAAEYHIPAREEGYGLSAAGLERLAGQGVGLVIAVDCGISDRAPIARARELGLDVVVIDHHQLPEALPEAAAVLDPLRPGCAFPAKDLAAVGLVFNLVMALRAALRARGAFGTGPEPNLRQHLDLVALGTVADIVPLLGENRILTQVGLQELAAGRRPGVAALKEIAGLTGPGASAADVAYRLAPRINALGRLGLARGGVELLTTSSYARALALAREMDAANEQRKAIEQQIFERASKLAEAALQDARPAALVLAEEGWHPGVVGIVASRLVERFGRPVVLLALDGERGKGSARGVEGVHLFEALTASAEHLAAFGGHRLAAGLTVRREALEAFRRRFVAVVAAQLGGAEPARVLHADGPAQPSEWSLAEVAELARLAPFGAGNPEPVFLARDLEVRGVRPVGTRPPLHLKAGLADGARTWDAIWFRQAERLDALRSGRVDVLYSPELNTWDGHTSLQLKLVDVRLSGG